MKGKNHNTAPLSKRRKKTSDLCAEYGVTPVTIWRWTKRGILDEPDKINGVNYWAADAEPRFDQEVAA